MRQSLLFFSGAGKFYLAHGMRQLTRDIKGDVKTLYFSNDVIYALLRKAQNDVRRRSFCDVKCHK